MQPRGLIGNDRAAATPAHVAENVRHFRRSAREDAAAVRERIAHCKRSRRGRDDRAVGDELEAQILRGPGPGDPLVHLRQIGLRHERDVEIALIVDGSVAAVATVWIG